MSENNANNNSNDKKETMESKQENNNATEQAKKETNGQDKLKELQEENSKIKDTLMRTLAELDNTRKRAIEENDKTSKYAISKFAEDLIPVMENFYLAFDSVKDNNLSDEKIIKSFFDGIKITHNELKKVFDKNGLTRVFPMGEMFDPDLHNAITQIESDKPEGTIVAVMQAGYKIKDRLLRPALVGVAKTKQ